MNNYKRKKNMVNNQYKMVITFIINYPKTKYQIMSQINTFQNNGY